MHTLTVNLQEHAARMRGEAEVLERQAAEIEAQPGSNWEEYDRVNITQPAKDLRAKASLKRTYAEYADDGKFAYRMDDVGRPYEFSALHAWACADSRSVKLDDQNQPMGVM